MAAVPLLRDPALVERRHIRSFSLITLRRSQAGFFDNVSDRFYLGDGSGSASTSSITFKVPSFRETYQLDGSAQAERQDALTVPVIEILYTLHSHYLAQIKPIRDVVKKTGVYPYNLRSVSFPSLNLLCCQNGDTYGRFR
jgi:hypothetical protein